MKGLKSNLTIIFILFVSCVFAQDKVELSRHESVNEFVQELIKNKIDTICDYEVFTEKTEAMYTQYIFWKENGKTKIKKLELEQNYPILEIPANEMWQNLLLNNDIIKNEKVESFSFTEKINGKDEVREVISEGNNFREFNFYLNSSITKFWTSSFDFQKTEKFDGKKQSNIYFEHNNNLKGKFIIDQLENIVHRLEKAKRFKK